MPENPLLPNRKLKDLYLLMARCRKLSRQQPSAPPLEAVLAAALLHLEPGDFLSSLPGNVAAQKLAEERGAATLPAGHRLIASAAAAHALKSSGAERLAMAFLAATGGSASAEADWQTAVTFAAKNIAPLLLFCVDTSGGKQANGKAAISWPSMLKLAAPLHLPVLPVDGADAVAMFRVVQESALRARAGGGPAVLWCVLQPGQRKPADDAMRKLRTWMSVRKIPIPTLQSR